MYGLINVSNSLIHWFHIYLIYHLTEQIGFVCIRKNKKSLHVKRLIAIAAVNYFMCAVKFNLICDLK